MGTQKKQMRSENILTIELNSFKFAVVWSSFRKSKVQVFMADSTKALRIVADQPGWHCWKAN